MCAFVVDHEIIKVSFMFDTIYLAVCNSLLLHIDSSKAFDSTFVLVIFFRI